MLKTLLSTGPNFGVHYDSTAAAGYALAAIFALFSGKSAASILTFNYGVSCWIANVSNWVAIGFENQTGSIGQDLIAATC